MLPEGRNPIKSTMLLNITPPIAQPQYVAVTTIKTYRYTYLIPVEHSGKTDPTIHATQLVDQQAVQAIASCYLGEQIVATEVIPLSQAIAIFDYECADRSSATISEKIDAINKTIMP